MAETHRREKSAHEARLPIVFLARVVLDTPLRIIYPFLPSIARGLGISVTAASGLITLRMVGGVGAPFFGSMADRLGRRRMMEVALLLFTLASLVLAGIGTLLAASIAFTLYGIAKALYDPTVHAYVGDTVPYYERGRAMGVVELSWSAAWLLGVPWSGFLIEHFGWRAPWIALIVLGLFAGWLTHACLLPNLVPTVREPSKPLVVSVVTTWRNLLGRRSVAVLLLTSLLLTLASEIPFIVYGAWIEALFGLSLTALGLASIVVGLADAAAELGAAAITDRLGKRRSVLVGLVASAVNLIALPWLSNLGLPMALTGIAFMVLTFEFGVVSLLALTTELAPDVRASLLSLNVTTSSLARIVGAFIGGWLWQWQSIGLNAGLGAVCAFIGALLLGRGMAETNR